MEVPASTGGRPDAALLELVFGDAADPMPLLERRARDLLGDYRAIVWEGDATNFEFRYVSASAEELLGYTPEQWTTEPTFWVDKVVHPEDREDAISYCALCTGKGMDHEFEYRAVTVDGRVLLLHDVVRVIKGKLGVAVLLRGIMIDVTPRADASSGRRVADPLG